MMDDNRVSVMDYEPKLREQFPGLHMRRNSGKFGVELGFSVGTFIAMEFLYDEGQLEHVMGVSIERLQIEGIHALGLQPRLDAYEAELRKLRGENASLDATVRRRNDTIARLEEQIDRLLNPEDTDD